MAFVTFSPLRSSSLNRPHLPRVCKATTRMTSDASVQNVSRRAFLSTLVSLTGSVIGVKALDASNDLQLKVVTEGKGPAPQIGDLVGIRFKGSYNGVVFDNLFNSTEPYFYRVGSGSVLKGIEETVMQMRVGEVVDVVLPGSKAFGEKGRRASAGKPSIPPNATIAYTIELTTIPGKEEELLERLDDAEIGSSV